MRKQLVVTGLIAGAMTLAFSAPTFAVDADAAGLWPHLV